MNGCPPSSPGLTLTTRSAPGFLGQRRFLPPTGDSREVWGALRDLREDGLQTTKIIKLLLLSLSLLLSSLLLLLLVVVVVVVAAAAVVIL